MFRPDKLLTSNITSCEECSKEGRQRQDLWCCQKKTPQRQCWSLRAYVHSLVFFLVLLLSHRRDSLVSVFGSRSLKLEHETHTHTPTAARQNDRTCQMFLDVISSCPASLTRSQFCPPILSSWKSTPFRLLRAAASVPHAIVKPPWDGKVEEKEEVVVVEGDTSPPALISFDFGDRSNMVKAFCFWTQYPRIRSVLWISLV